MTLSSWYRLSVRELSVESSGAVPRRKVHRPTVKDPARGFWKQAWHSVSTCARLVYDRVSKQRLPPLGVSYTENIGPSLSKSI